ncbi:MAG: heavy-metal-associated domain-containing protein [Bacteroidetes bacterium]|nr:heavy-metal-associated domain-containing protein [Bacteroidota bacterium]
MKKNIIALILGIITLYNAQAMSLPQAPPVKAQFKASGNCGQCKERIEQALDVPGIKHAVYLTEEQIVQVSFNASKISLEQIQRLVSQAGHDTELFKASDQVYQTLPGCCRYREGACHDHSGN